MKKDIVKTITSNAIVAAIYFLLTFASSSVGSGVIQVRLAEALVLLCFFKRDFTFGITLGCLLSNLFSPLLPWDLLIGTAATLLSCLLVSFCKHLLFASVIPVVINGFAVGAEFAYIGNSSYAFWPSVGFIAIGEFLAVCVFGYLIFKLLLCKNKEFLIKIGANRNLDFKF
ncbi:MAG: QueT transporter family protein [Clostridia bacterium]|nr:QueT transporter family protein [Clostridia bacterium]